MTKYDIRTGITKIKTKTAIAISAAVLSATSLGFAVAIPAISHASSVGDGTDYGTQPGFSVSLDHTQCAGHGAFDAFGKNFNFGNSTSGHVPYPGNAQNGNGADGQATAANNSSLCGNPQN